MRQTPRHVRSSRGGIGTLIGNGWLRESPRNAWLHGVWEARGKSAMRKCMFMAVPTEIKNLLPADRVSGAPLLPYAPPRAPRVAAEEVPFVPYRNDPRRNVREFAAYAPREAASDSRVAVRQAHAIQVQNAQKNAAAAAAGKDSGARAWWEDPVALGSLLILVPPIGLAAVWSSKRYSSDARWALTVMTALTMCLMTAIAMALVMR